MGRGVRASHCEEVRGSRREMCNGKAKLITARQGFTTLSGVLVYSVPL